MHLSYRGRSYQSVATPDTTAEMNRPAAIGLYRGRPYAIQTATYPSTTYPQPLSYRGIQY